MSSTNQPINFADLAMINRVMARAGYRGTPAEVDDSETSEAARYLLARFHDGVMSEEEFGASLNQRGRSTEPAGGTPAQVKAEALDRWQDEGGAPSRDDLSRTEEKGRRSWNGRSIGGTLSVGAVVFIGPEGSPSTGQVPELAHHIRLTVNGERWKYSVVSATSGSIRIQSRDHNLILVAAGSDHPVTREGVTGVENASAWTIVAIVSRS